MYIDFEGYGFGVCLRVTQKPSVPGGPAAGGTPVPQGAGPQKLSTTGSPAARGMAASSEAGRKLHPVTPP